MSTKAESTKYLSNKLISHYQNKPKRVLVMHHTTMIANHSVSDIVSMPEMAAGQHNLEEGDQLVLLNAFDVMDKNPQSTLDVFSVDTDVFVLLLGHFPLLPKSTTLLRKKGDRISIEESYRRLGPKRTEALIGWYAFKGMDNTVNTGSFAGKGVLSHFNAFMQADEEILKAFTAFGLTQELYQHVSLIKWGGICVYSTRPQTSVRIVLENLGGHYLHKKIKRASSYHQLEER